MAFPRISPAHLPVQYNPFRLWDDGKLKKRYSPVCVIGCAKLTEGLFYRAPRCVLHI